MITPEHEYFIRFILLLLQGGASLLRGIANKALQKKGMSLNQFLSTVESKVRSSSKLSNKQKLVLFPGTSQSPSIEDFDITLLSYLIIKHLKGELDGNELNAVNHIRDMRNNYQAHATDAKMDSKTFTKEWSKLVRIIITVGTKMSEEEQKRLNDTIDNIENEHLDIKFVIEEIKRLDESNAFFEKIQHGLEDIRRSQERLSTKVSNVLDVTQGTSVAVSRIENNTQHMASEVSNIDSDLQQTVSVVSTINSTTQQMASAVRTIDDTARITSTVTNLIHKTTQETSAATIHIQENIHQTSANVKNILENTQNVLGAVCSANETTQETHANVQDVQEATKLISAELVEVHKTILDMRSELVKIKEQQENQGKKTKVVNTVFGRIKISADDQETVDKAESILLKATIDSVTNSPTESHREVKERVDMFLEDVRKFDVEVQNVRTGSIIIEFRCNSLRGVVDLIDYFDSPGCQKCMDEIAIVLEGLLCKKICANAYIDSQSIRDIITKMVQKEHEKIIQFDMSCPGIDGLIHAIDIFEDGKAANSLNELSKALSDAVGKSVTLRTSIDVEQMGRAIQKMRGSLGIESKEDPTCYNSINAGTGITEVENVDRETVPPAKKAKVEMETMSRIDFQTRGLAKDERVRTDNDFQIAHCESGESESHPNRPTQRHTINVKTKLDKKKCGFTGCAVLGLKTVLLVDKNNEKLKVIDTQNKIVVYEQNLYSQPWDVAVLPKQEICVTLPNKEELVFFSTAVEISIVRNVQMNRKCWGVTYNNACIYVVCWNPIAILVMDIQGTIQREILLNTEQGRQLDHPRYIDTSKDLNHFYISDFISNYVVRVTLEGDLTTVRQEGFSCAQGLVVIEDGSLLVCCWSGIVCHVSADLKEIYNVIRDIPKAKCVCYKPDTRQVYVAGDACDYITVFTLQD